MASLFERLPADVFTECVSFLWFPDLDNLCCCSQMLKRAVKTGKYLYSPKLIKVMKLMNGTVLDRSRNMEKHARLLAQRATYWPTSVDYRELAVGISVEMSADRSSFTYHYSGESLGGNRVIYADMHFPCMDLSPEVWKRTDSEVVMASFPFTKSCVLNGQLTAHLSCVAYFEVTIGPIPGYIEERNSSARVPRHSRHPCVSVGLVNPRCPATDQMPGWDHDSYGYHGDDGHFYHGSGVGVRFGPTFGTGDVIGCGVVYPPLVLSPPVLFFVKNGEFVQSITLQESFLKTPFFPAVGVDSFASISLNFGASPFVFDVIDFENKQIEKRMSAPHPLHDSMAADGSCDGSGGDGAVEIRDESWAFDVFYKGVVAEQKSLTLWKMSAGAVIYNSHNAYTTFQVKRMLSKPILIPIDKFTDLLELMNRHDAEEVRYLLSHERFDDSRSRLTHEQNAVSYKSEFEVQQYHSLHSLLENLYDYDGHSDLSEFEFDDDELENMSEDSSDLGGDEEEDDNSDDGSDDRDGSSSASSTNNTFYVGSPGPTA